MDVRRTFDGQGATLASSSARRKVQAMKKAEQYREHAAECRALAAQMQRGEHRDQLLRMAAAWQELATDREEALARADSHDEATPLDGV